eukprot:SAG11_NODE_3262_length_2571_cov_2.300971_1_plen_86_part_00
MDVEAIAGLVWIRVRPRQPKLKCVYMVLVCELDASSTFTSYSGGIVLFVPYYARDSTLRSARSNDVDRWNRLSPPEPIHLGLIGP